MRGGVQVRERKRGNEGEYGLASGCTCNRDVDGGTCVVSVRCGPHTAGVRGGMKGEMRRNMG